MKSQITMVEREILRILESFMHGGVYHLPENFNRFEELSKVSQMHKILPIVYEQIREEAVLDQEENRAIRASMKSNSIYSVMSQIQRTNGFLNVYRQLCQVGVQPLVVKGIICRNLYSNPDLRVSGDEDMLIKRENFEVCDRILLENGFQRSGIDLKEMPYEVAYYQPGSGTYIELHCSLFPENSGEYGHLNDEFDRVYERCIFEEIQGTRVWTLSPTDHMFYLNCHSFKHFLHSGFGIRQVCDMVMMAEHYGGRIDWEKIYKKLRRLNMLTFWAGLASIGKHFLGFDWEKAQYLTKIQKADVGAKELLVDLMQSGVYGNSTEERKHSSNVTLAAVKTGKKDTMTALRYSAFPSYSYMKQKYEWLEKYPFLLPGAWGMRIFSYLAHAEKHDNGQSGLEIGMERVELLKKYHIIH